MSPTQRSDRVEALLAELTIDEKAALTIGSGPWHTAPLPDRGVGRVKVTDGPTGARGDGRSGATATCFPVGVALGATWSTELLHEVGAALAAEARTKGAHVLLGPTVNLQRTPIGGRNFECYAEDPLLTAMLAVAFVNGVQSGGVGTSMKHFVGNDTEVDRHHISADMDERTLREVALLPFELAVRHADPWTIMAAYNQVNGETATANRRLLTTILRDEWGWQGAVVSDWGAVKGTLATALAGCDLEMPGPLGWLGPNLATAVRAGDLPAQALDDLARHVLVLAERAGRLDDTHEPAEASVDDPGRRGLTRRAATEGTVLLRNDGLLPLDTATLRRIAVIGPNVAAFMVQGGGSSQVQPHGAIVGPLPAFRDALGSDVEIVHEPGCTTAKFASPVPPGRWTGADDDDGPPAPPSASSMATAIRSEEGPVLVEFFDGLQLDGDPVWSYRADGISTTFFGAMRRLPDQSSYSGRMTGRYHPTVTGTHTFGLSVVGPGRLSVEGNELIDNWTAPQPGDTFFAMGSAEVRGSIDLEAGQPVEVVVEFARDPLALVCGVRLGVEVPQPPDLFERAVTAAAAADVAVVIVGTTAEWETEGNDRSGIELPGRQAELIEAVAGANPRTVVVVNAGSPVDMAWADRAGAVLQVWFGGQEMGPALVDVLLGRADPGGRLPHTVPVRLEDHPAAATYPGADGHLPYDEGVLAGHRWYDAHGIEPRYPFGHGLSYASFEWDQPTVDRPCAPADDLAVTVIVAVANVGDRPGHEVVQLYVSPPAASGRPVRELKAFAKVTLDPGGRSDVVLRLDDVAFRHWDEEAAGWAVDPGTYDLVVAASSRDLRGTVSFDVTAGPPE